MTHAALSERPKLIYFAERPPRLDRDSFIARWRRHAELGMSQARWKKNIYRYAHCDAAGAPGPPIPAAPCDGVAMVWYLNEDARLRHASDPAAPLMKADERRTFARPVSESAVLADEWSIRPFPPSPRKLFVRLRCGRRAARREFKDLWLGEFAPRLVRRLERGGANFGYAQNHARGTPGGTAPGPVCDCVDEIGCDGGAQSCERAFLAAMDEVGAQRLGLGLDAVWTVETLLYSR